MLDRARREALWTRAYVSTAFGCPFTGAVDPSRVIDLALRLVDLGAQEVCLGDTIGVGVPSQVHDLTGRLLDAGLAAEGLAYHFHDTRGTALANVLAGLEEGVSTFDAFDRQVPAAAPSHRAPRAISPPRTSSTCSTAWASTTACSLAGVLEAARSIAAALGRPLAAKVGQAGRVGPGHGGSTSRSEPEAPDADRPRVSARASSATMLRDAQPSPGSPQGDSG